VFGIGFGILFLRNEAVDRRRFGVEGRPPDAQTNISQDPALPCRCFYTPFSTTNLRKLQPTKMTKTKKFDRLSQQVGPRKLLDAYQAGLTSSMQRDLPSIAAMLNPQDSEAVRLPDDLVAASAVFTAPAVFDLPSAGIWDPNLGTSSAPAVNESGESVLALIPGTKGAIWHTAGAEQEICDGISDFHLKPVLTSNGGQTGTRFLSNPIRDGSVAIVPRRDATGRAIYELQVLGGVGQGIGLYIQEIGNTNSKITGTLDLQYRAVVGGPWISNIVPFYGSTTLDLPLASVVEAIAIEVTVASSETNTLVFGITAAATLGLPTTINSKANRCTNFHVRDFTRLANLDLTSMERPTALAGLLTYMGSNLLNGGLITAARLPMGESITLAPNGDFYSFIASLPTYNGDYALRDGCYCWWCPDDPQEFFMRPHSQARCDDMRVNSSLWYVAKRDSRDQVVRVRAHTHIEALTRSVQYSTEVHAPSPTWGMLLSMAKTLPAVTENPFHKFLANIWNKFKETLSNPAQIAKIVTGARKLFL